MAEMSPDLVQLFPSDHSVNRSTSLFVFLERADMHKCKVKQTDFSGKYCMMYCVNAKQLLYGET